MDCKVTYFVTLCEHEMLLLDGHCSDEVQKKIDKSKRYMDFEKSMSGLSTLEARFIAMLVEEAEVSGKLMFEHRSLTNCDVCGKVSGYKKFARNSRHHRAGDIDKSKREYFNGHEFKEGFVNMKGHTRLGCCSDCWTKLQPVAADKLKSTPSQIPEAIIGFKSGYKKVERIKCLECGWMGHNKYSHNITNCPLCHSSIGAFSNTGIHHISGFAIIDPDDNVVRHKTGC